MDILLKQSLKTVGFLRESSERMAEANSFRLAAAKRASKFDAITARLDAKFADFEHRLAIILLVNGNAL
jgi:hypothetical protein